jgi:hypothetical protein
LRFTKARCKHRSVEGFKITAILLRRLGDTKSVQTPSASRSHEVSFGTRRARFMMSNWCLTSNDSAATAPRPPGLASRAKVTSRWAIKLNSNLIKTNLNRVGTFHKSALQRRVLPESVFRHT